MRISRKLGAFLATLLAVANCHQATAEDQTGAFKEWFQRAVFDKVSFEDATKSNMPLKIGKWYGPIRIQIFDELLAPDQRAEVKSYIQEYAQAITAATNITVSIVPSDSKIEPNLLVFVDDNVVQAVKSHMPVVRSVFLGDQAYIDEKFLYAEGNDSINCYYRVPIGKNGVAARGIIVAPRAEDIYATQKCLATRLYQGMGLVGLPTDPESVVHREAAVIEPNALDREILAIHYLPGVDRGATIQEVQTAIALAVQEQRLTLDTQ